tara:strand:+ start:347 stop:1426 length:1080 start_codon:yes stop_codon:yes gene_type:complete
MTRPSRVIIDIKALEHNFSRIKELVHNSKVMAIIKADAYGHGIVRVAKTLRNADAFGVACLEEAEQLRIASITTPIILLEGPYKPNDLSLIIKLNLEVVIHNEYQLELLEKSKIDGAIKVWLKIDTGMHRLGFSVDKTEEMLRRLMLCRNINSTPILMSHLATANEKNHALTYQQLDTFREISKIVNIEKTIANSAAVINFPDVHFDWVRPGLMLYGVSPLINSCGHDHGLKSVMTLESEIISIQYLSKGEPVGYGATWRCPENMPVGIIAAGYGDGFPRHAKSGTPILVNNIRCPLIGRASMDMLTIDLRNQSNAKIGDRVVLWGGSLPIEEIATYAETIPYELLCGVHKRLQFVEYN